MPPTPYAHAYSPHLKYAIYSIGCRNLALVAAMSLASILVQLRNRVGKQFSSVVNLASLG